MEVASEEDELDAGLVRELVERVTVEAQPPAAASAVVGLGGDDGLGQSFTRYCALYSRSGKLGSVALSDNEAVCHSDLRRSDRNLTGEFEQRYESGLHSSLNEKVAEIKS